MRCLLRTLLFQTLLEEEPEATIHCFCILVTAVTNVVGVYTTMDGLSTVTAKGQGTRVCFHPLSCSSRSARPSRP